MCVRACVVCYLCVVYKNGAAVCVCDRCTRMPARCAPNAEGAVNLQDILESFNAPIKEEHAWALCYQCAKCFNEALSYNRDKCCNVSDVSHVWVHGDGTVHASTIFAGGGNNTGRNTNTHYYNNNNTTSTTSASNLDYFR